jgi:hypothetical protein
VEELKERKYNIPKYIPDTEDDDKFQEAYFGPLRNLFAKANQINERHKNWALTLEGKKAMSALKSRGIVTLIRRLRWIFCVNIVAA